MGRSSNRFSNKQRKRRPLQMVLKNFRTNRAPHIHRRPLKILRQQNERKPKPRKHHPRRLPMLQKPLLPNQRKTRKPTKTRLRFLLLIQKLLWIILSHHNPRHRKIQRFQHKLFWKYQLKRLPLQMHHRTQKSPWSQPIMGPYPS